MSHTIYLHESLAAQIHAHASETYPNECCGALIGSDEDGGREVLQVFRLTNRRDDSPKNRFSISAEDVLAAEGAARKGGLSLLGWYHSHPDHPSAPSKYDQDHAWPWYSYMILSIEKGLPKQLSSWQLRDDRTEFEPEEVVLTKTDRARVGS